MALEGETQGSEKTLSDGWLVFWLSMANIVGLLGLQAFPSLLPTFIAEWTLTNAQAGWLNGIYFAGYMLTVPFLLSVTDVVDARVVFLWSSALGFVGLVGFAWMADGFWSALIFRSLQGMAYAGSYMPGLKVLTDRVQGENPSRGIAIYTSSYLIAGSLSVYLSGELEAVYGWRLPFWGAGLGATAALLIVLFATKAKPPPPRLVHRHLLDFRPVLRHRKAVGYMVAYAMHNWELMASLSWTVTYLAAVQEFQPSGTAVWNITAVAAVLGLVSLPASMAGNELALRFGRRNTACVIMLFSAVVGVVVGFGAALPFSVVIALRALYGITATGESSTVTAGTIMSVPAEIRGAAMAIHSTIGFGGAFMGPLAFGIALDLMGGRDTIASWGVAGIVSGAGLVVGVVALWWLVDEE